MWFNGATRIRGTDVEFDRDTDPTTILVTLPESVPAGSVTVEVENLDGQSSNLVALTVIPPAPKFVRMDANMDTDIDISDPLVVVRHLFAGLAVDCEDALDAVTRASADDARLLIAARPAAARAARRPQLDHHHLRARRGSAPRSRPCRPSRSLRAQQRQNSSIYTHSALDLYFSRPELDTVLITNSMVRHSSTNL